jgi:ubiquinone/menaquinone biosynthesis C-methylase UbiE
MLTSLLRTLFRIREKSPASRPDQPRRLHLGCGKDIREGWINLDSRRLPGVNVVADLDDCRTTSLPLSDNSIDEFFGSHVLEHLRDPLAFMQELHRIASDGAKLTFHLPYGSSDDAYADPTHVRAYFESSFQFFSQPVYTRADYGYRGDWKTESVELTIDAALYRDKSDEQLRERIYSQRNVVLEMIATLTAVKPARAPGDNQTDSFPVIVSPVHRMESNT